VFQRLAGSVLQHSSQTRGRRLDIPKLIEMRFWFLP
jgi:hypothetical protein